MNPRIKVIIRNLITGLIITAVTAIAFQIYYGSIYTGYILIYGVIISAVISKAFLLPFAKMKIEGTVTKARVSMYTEARPARMLSGKRQIRIAVTVKTVQGHRFWKSFDFKGDADDLPVGTKIRFTVFDDRPEVLKYPHYKKPQNERY